jgi:hypothetical protein
MRIYNYGIASGAYGRAGIIETNGNKPAEKSPANKRTERSSAAGISTLEKMRGQTGSSADVLEYLRDTVSLGGSANSSGFTPGYSRALYNMGFRMLKQ